MENHASVLGIAARKSNLFSRFKSGGCYRSYVDFICLRHIEKERVRIAIRCARNYIRADLCVLFRFDTVLNGTAFFNIIFSYFCFVFTNFIHNYQSATILFLIFPAVSMPNRASVSASANSTAAPTPAPVIMFPSRQTSPPVYIAPASPLSIPG